MCSLGTIDLNWNIVFRNQNISEQENWGEEEKNLLKKKKNLLKIAFSVRFLCVWIDVWSPKNSVLRQ